MKKHLNTLTLWTLILCPLPLLWSLFYVFSRFQDMDQLALYADRIQTQSLQVKLAKNKEASLLQGFEHPDLHYLDKHVESLSLLLPEIKKLETLHNEYPDDVGIAKKWQGLKSSANKIRFSEEQIRSKAPFREVEEKQEQPVEMNEEDLKRLLCLIEGVSIWPYGPKEGKPPLIIKDLKLSKKELLGKEKTFVVTLELIKRETLPKAL